MNRFKRVFLRYWPIIPAFAGGALMGAVDWRIPLGMGLWVVSFAFVLLPPAIDPEAMD